jgi:hypothetical protein
MRLILAALIGAFAMTARAADFPPPAKLPANPNLPDPLTTFAGKKVTSPEEWRTRRRPELKQLFQHYMYGRYPTVKPHVVGKVVHEDKQALGGKATLREVALTVADGAPPVYVLIVTPNKRTGPAPAFVGLNFCGNHCLTPDPKVHVPEGWMYAKYPGVKNNRASAAGRGTQMQVWPLETIIDRGYALATAYDGGIIPDSAKVRGGLADLLMPAGRDAADDTGTIMAWAWGVHRMVDYLTAMPEIDAKRIAAVGHSRLGKTAIVATAFDDRIALGVPSQAGCGGTAPSRTHNPKSETVKRINTNFPHWFDGNFKQFNDAAERLPFDQNCLVAICAPRPVLFTCAAEDQWANPPGQFDVLKAATPAYKLLGVDGMTADAMPPVGKLLDSRLGYWTRPGTHAMTPADWQTYLAFADKWLK